jgi:hypothetical protein
MRLEFMFDMALFPSLRRISSLRLISAFNIPDRA